MAKEKFEVSFVEAAFVESAMYVLKLPCLVVEFLPCCVLFSLFIVIGSIA